MQAMSIPPIRQRAALLLALLFAPSACAVDTDDDVVTDARLDRSGGEDSAADMAPDDSTADTPREPDAGEDAEPDVDPRDLPSDAPDPDAEDVAADTSVPDEGTPDATEEGELGIDLGGADIDLCEVSHTRPSGTRPYVLAGTGVLEYEPVSHCDELFVINGIQGGQHVWGGFEANGFRTTETVHIDFEVRQNDVRVARAEYVDRLVLVGERYEYPGVAIVLEDGVTGDDIDGIPAVMRVRVWNDDGLDLRDEVRFTPICCDF
jgi:hypothetical protein